MPGRIRTSVFQSTPPVKAATEAQFVCGKQNEISIHAAREGGDFLPAHVPHSMGISIHAAREGGDAGGHTTGTICTISIHAAREGGDVKICRNAISNSISIHAAREGGDCRQATHTG